MTSPQQSLVIIGNGMATGRLLDEIRSYKSEGFAITVISDEAVGCYNRIMLSSVLAGEASADTIMLKSAEWYHEQGITLLREHRVTSIDRTARRVTCTNGHSLDYDHLVIATGSRPATIPAGKQELGNIFSFRTLADTAKIDQAAKTATHAVVIGGGLLGLEAAYGLAKAGVKVSLVHRSAWLLNRQLDPTAGQLLQASMAKLGIQFHLGTEVSTFVGEEKVSGAELLNGKVLDAELVVIATGITPNAELGKEAGLAGKRGIAVDDYMATDDSAISALGECVEHRGQTFGLVDPIWDQCRTLAARLCGGKPQAFSQKPVATKLKVSGINLFSAGLFLDQDNLDTAHIIDRQKGVYRKVLVDKANRIQGAVLFGDVRGGMDYFAMMLDQHICDISLADIAIAAPKNTAQVDL